MAYVTNAALHSSVQLAGAATVGTLIDSLFPLVNERVGTPNDKMMDAVEIVAQIALGGVVTAGIISFLDNTLSVDAQDPTNGIGYSLGFITSQPNMLAKLQRLLTGFQARTTEVLAPMFIAPTVPVVQQHSQMKI